MFHLLAFFILLLLIAAVTGSGWWIIPFLAFCAWLATRPTGINVNIHVDDKDKLS